MNQASNSDYVSDRTHPGFGVKANRRLLPSRKATFGLIAFTLASATAPGQSEPMAQSDADAPERLEDITVEAERVPKSTYIAESSDTVTFGTLAELPFPIQVFTDEFIDDINALRLADVLEYAVSAQRENAFGNTNDAIILRGFPVTYAEDGVSTSGAIAPIIVQRDVATIERVEVLRGPSSALFGETAPGGIVNVITKKPEAETFLKLRTVVSSFERYRQEFDGNLAFGANEQFQSRLSGSVEYFDSFRDFVEGERYVVAPAIDYLVNDDLTISYRGEIINAEQPFDRGIPVDQNTGEPLADPEDFFGDPTVGDIDNFYLRNEIRATYQLSDQWTVRALGNLAYNRFRGASLEPVFLPSETVFFEPVPGVIPPNTVVFATENEEIVRQFRDRDFEAYLWTGRVDASGEFSTGAVEHDLYVGLDLRYLDDRRDQEQSTIGDPSNIVLRSNPVIDQSNTTVTQTNELSDEVTNLGVSLFDRISIHETFDVLLGGRLDWIDRTNISNGNRNDIDEVAFSPSVGAVYRPVSWGSLFGRYAESFEINTAVDNTNEPLDPRNSNTFEGGLRLNFFEGQLNTTLAYFFIEQDNFPLFDPSTGFAEPVTAQSQGVELSVQAEVFDSLSLLFNYTYMNTEISNAFGPAEGSSLQGAADHSANLFANYTLPFEDRFGGVYSIQGGMVYVGERLNSVRRTTPLVGANVPGIGFVPLPDTETGGAELDPYVQFDLGIRYEIAEWLDVSFAVQNVFDESYTRPSSPGFTLPEAPRTFLGSVTVRF